MLRYLRNIVWHCIDMPLRHRSLGVHKLSLPAIFQLNNLCLAAQTKKSSEKSAEMVKLNY